ncbi:MAG: helix-turn-helix domain-containing protein [Eubacterium sp.]
MDYKTKLRDLRIDKDITQTQLAKILGVKQAAISKYELGLREYKIEDLIKLCKFYNVSADYILDLPKDLPYPER